MENSRPYGNIFRLDGVNQLQRMPLPLELDYILPDERSLVQLIDYVRQVAAQIRYYNLSGQAVGDWQAFFNYLANTSTNEIISEDELQNLLGEKKDFPPHVALFLVFLNLYQVLQSELNRVPVRHLAHFYEHRLGLKRILPLKDDVHIVFELAKNYQASLLPAGTQLDAGKDPQGNLLIYQTNSDILVSPTTITNTYRQIKELDKRGNPRIFQTKELSDIEGESWSMFGAPQLARDLSQRFMQEVEQGFAVSSPVLLMAEGCRKITVIFSLKGDTRNIPNSRQINFAMLTDISAEEGWIAPSTYSIRFQNDGFSPATLVVDFEIEESAPAIVAPDPELHPDSPLSVSPVIRFILKGESGLYQLLETIEIESFEISIQVGGVKTLVVQNQNNLLDVQKPMPLFGNQPFNGATFYIGSDEVFSKKLSSFELEFSWQDLPSDLYAHYREYFVNHTNQLENEFVSQFDFSFDILYARSWRSLFTSPQNLFAYSDPEFRSISVNLQSDAKIEQVFTTLDYQAQPPSGDSAAFDVSSKRGFIRMVLDGPTYAAPYAPEIPFNAFGHKAFAPRLAQQAIAASQTETVIDLPKPPYTPMLSNISINYSASVEVTVAEKHQQGSFYTLDSFGYYQADVENAAKLVPEMAEQASLFIAVKNASIPGNISFLFQMEIGTATTSGEPLAIDETEWHYLAGKKWQAIAKSDILSDSTFGFQKPGIVVLAVGADASLQHQRMPEAMLWLKASISKPFNSACRVLQIHDRAVTASLQVTSEDLPNYNQHLGEGLVAETISKLKKRNAAIKKVMQPYPSFNGRAQESDNNFFQTSSERLRHRNRAVNLWDMQRLVLNAFPQIFKVKCLSHSNQNGEQAAGEQALVILPDMRKTNAGNPLQPRADSVLMQQIEDYVQGLATPFAKLHIIHPVYERIRVDAQVKIQHGFDAGYYSAILNQELIRYLSPWAYEEGQDIVFATRIYRSEILAFIEGREYIDYVVNFKLFHVYQGATRGGIDEMAIDLDFIVYPDPQPSIGIMEVGDSYIVGRGVEVAMTTRPHAILVSHAQHRIIPISAEDELCSGIDQLGIGYMAIALDFDVAV